MVKKDLRRYPTKNSDRKHKKSSMLYINYTDNPEVCRYVFGKNIYTRKGIKNNVNEIVSNSNNLIPDPSVTEDKKSIFDDAA